MYTIIELPTFSADAKTIWDEAELGEFCSWLAEHPLAGDVIPGSGGCRKVRWARSDPARANEAVYGLFITTGWKAA